jgi:ornithine carbamoyltransferase
MTSELKGKDFITTQDWSVEELEQALELAAELKAKRATGEPTPLLPAKTLYMIFFDASTRTRNSFETGITQLGGHGIYLSPDKMQISHGENARDTANVLSRYGEAIAIRHCAFREGNDYIREVAENASVPVISMQCDVYHPCQILADLLTIRERCLDLGPQLRATAVGTPEPDPAHAPLRHRRHPRLPARVSTHAGDRGASQGQRRGHRREVRDLGELRGRFHRC